MIYDIAFIGGGPGGYEGAILAGKRGLKAVVVEMGQLGGTCLQRGCIPTKAILHSIRTVKHIRDAAKIGIEIDGYRVSPETIQKRKNRIVTKLTKGIELQFNQNHIDLIRGHGTITAPDTIMVNDTEVKAKTIVIATGSSAVDLPFLKRDGNRILSSDDLLNLDIQAEHLVVIGAGAVGLEWGTIYRYLGSRVTVIEIMPAILPGSDLEITEILRNELHKQEITIHTGAAVSAPADLTGPHLDLPVQKDGKSWTERCSHILLAVGRKPNTDQLFPAGIGIERDTRGFIQVDRNLRTGCPTIFACGDVIGQPLLAHKASHQAMAIVDLLVSGKEIRPHPLPAAVFTFPEVASVGITEEEANKRPGSVRIGRFPYAAGSRANAIEEKIGLIKIVADEKNHILGAHIIGAEAGELMPLLSYAVQNHLSAEDFRGLVCIHPTLSEGVWEAIGGVGGFSIHV